MRRRLHVFVLCALTLATAACGGGNGPTGPSSTAPLPYTQSLSDNVGAFGTTRHLVTVPRGGNMVIRLTWPDGSVDLDLFLAPSSCTSLYPKASCGIYAQSEAITGSSEQVSRPVTSGETYHVFVDNLDFTKGQTYTLNLTIS